MKKKGSSTTRSAAKPAPVVIKKAAPKVAAKAAAKAPAKAPAKAAKAAVKTPKGKC
jgi:hypothetical protein